METYSKIPKKYAPVTLNSSDLSLKSQCTCPQSRDTILLTRFLLCSSIRVHFSTRMHYLSCRVLYKSPFMFNHRHYCILSLHPTSMFIHTVHTYISPYFLCSGLMQKKICSVQIINSKMVAVSLIKTLFNVSGLTLLLHTAHITDHKHMKAYGTLCTCY